jgi:hypothetical protein
VRPPTRPPRLGLPPILLGLLLSTACGSTPPPKDTRTTGVASNAPGEFQAMRSVLARLGRLRDAGDAANARALFPEVLREGKGLLLMPPPADLKRESVPRFLEGRGAFGDALNAYGREADGRDDAALWAATRRVDDSFWAWYDAYRGRPGEGEV